MLDCAAQGMSGGARYGGFPAKSRTGSPCASTISTGGGLYIAIGPGSEGSRNGDVVSRLYMDLAMISPAHPNMLLWGQLRRCKAHWMWRLKLRKFVKFGQGVREGGFATSAAASLYEIVLSVLTWDRTHGGGDPIVFCSC
jgi:hypothetical protein